MDGQQHLGSAAHVVQRDREEQLLKVVGPPEASVRSCSS